MHTLSIVGTRPNFVKMAPVHAQLCEADPDGRHVMVHTDQHYDHMMSQVFLEELGVPEPTHRLGVGSGSHAQQTARVMERLEPIIEEEQPDVVIVPGDVNSTLAATLVAAKLTIPVPHVESGLRSFDRTMPEEINRVVADALAEHLFVHSDEAVANLRAEGIAPERIRFVGNTMIDSLVAVEPRLRELDAAARHGVTPGDFLLVTLHRPALVDGDLLAAAVQQLNAVAREMPVVFPVHPRTRARVDALGLETGFRLVEPVGYLEFLSLEASAAAVLTDSGGVQEETTYLGVPCFTLRDNTERPVTVRCGTNTLLGLAPERIADIVSLLVAPSAESPAPEGWDGRAAERLVDALVHDLRGTAPEPVLRREALLRPDPDEQPIVRAPSPAKDGDPVIRAEPEPAIEARVERL
jgi:UDP-N-acetylglucosamine 2-epimerase (non-hydrolysing)